jgi:hypothetical protein
MHLMEFNPNFTYVLQSAIAKDNVHHKDDSSILKIQYTLLRTTASFFVRS